MTRKTYAVAVLFSSLLLCCGLLINADPAAMASGYSVVDLGVLPGGTFSSATSINNKGQIVGKGDMGQKAGTNLRTSPTYLRATEHSFLWQQGRMRELKYFPVSVNGSLSPTLRINDLGDILMASGDRSLLWHEGHLFALTSLDINPYVNPLNNKGHVVGSYQSRVTLWQNGQARNLGFFPMKLSVAEGINDFCQIIGIVQMLSPPSREPQAVLRHAFFWSNGQMTDLGTLGSADNSSDAVALNNKGQVVGSSISANGGGPHPFLWHKGRMIQLARDGSAIAINNKDAILIQSSLGVSAGIVRADNLLWQAGKLTDLQSLMPKKSGWILDMAQSINDRGQIVGVGRHNGKRRAFLMSPK